MADLHTTIARLADAFARDVLAAVRSTPLEELTSASGARGAGHRPPPERAPPAERASRVRRARKGARRSPGDLQKTIDAIVAMLQKNPNGMRSEEIQAALGATLKDIARPIFLALKAKAIRKKGQKRGTTYFAA